MYLANLSLPQGIQMRRISMPSLDGCPLFALIWDEILEILVSRFSLNLVHSRLSQNPHGMEKREKAGQRRD